MKICSINELTEINFNVVFLNALQQFWHTTKSYHFIGMPKKQNLFLYLDGCNITYTNKNNETFVAQSGDVVYTPIGSEYKAELSDFRSQDSHTVGINFLLFDQSGEPLALSEEITIFHGYSNKTLPMLFHQALTYDTLQPLLRTRILFMEILCALASYAPHKTISERIANALHYLSEHIEENPTISELAGLCNVSEVYFRKQFKECLGTTPLKYRNALRLGRASSYLEYGDISIQEISDMLGYSTVSHFIKEFRMHYGCSPLQYRKQNQN